MKKRSSRMPMFICSCAITLCTLALVYYAALRETALMELDRGGHGHGHLLVALPFLVAIIGTVCLVQAYLMEVDTDARRGCVQGIVALAGLLLLLTAVGIIGIYWVAWQGRGV